MNSTIIYHFNRRMKAEKVEKFVGNLNYKKKYIVYIRTLKQALNRMLVLKNSI